MIGPLSGPARDHKLFYRLLQVVGRPLGAGRTLACTPWGLDRDLPLLAGLVLLFIWGGAAIANGRYLPADGCSAVKMKAALSYHLFRAQGVAWLAIGRHEKARKIIDHLRRCEPRMAAQLESEFGVQGRAGQWAHAMPPQGAAMDMAGNAAH